MFDKFAPRVVEYFQGYYGDFAAREKLKRGDFLMKKLRIFMMSIFVLALGTFLVACDLKKPEVTFDKKEIVVSVHESISLDEYLSVKGVEKKNVTFKLENPDLLSLDGRTLVAGDKSGKSYVHALYKKNILASMQIVIKDKFKAPTFSDNPLSNDGVFSWNPVSAFYGNEVVPAIQYKVEGTCTVYSPADPSLVVETISIKEMVSETSLKLSRNGVYHLRVSALGTGYFDDGALSEEITLSVGYIQPAENFVWNHETGVLTWDGTEEEDAEYAIKFDGIELAQRQSAKSLNLSERLSLASAGDHTVSIVAYDTNGVLLAVESETVVITKLALPEAEYVYDAQNGGRVKIATAENVYEFAVDFEKVTSFANNTAKSKTIFSRNEGKDIVSTFDDLDAGLYNVKIVAKTNGQGGFFFQSDELELGKVYKLPTASIEGAGGNAVGGTGFGVNLTSQANPVDVLLMVNGLGAATVVEGFGEGESNFNFELSLSNVGGYTISLKQIPIAAENLIGGEEVYIINSNESDPLLATKVDAVVGGVRHSYNKDGYSVLTFAKTRFGKNYVLQVNEGSGYKDVLANKISKVEVGRDDVEIVLNGKLEDLFETVFSNGKNIFDLKIVCKGETEENSINETVEKQIEMLSAPQTANAGNSSSKVYSWTGANGAEGYEVQLFKIDKNIYDANKNASQINIQTAGLENLGKVTDGLQIDIDEVGYYYVKVFALTGDEDSHISSSEALEEVFYICERLEVENVELGKGDNGFYISIENGQNVTSYEVLLNDTSIGRPAIASGQTTEFLISDALNNPGSEYKISVVAHSENEEIYNASLAYELAVERLRKVSSSDINISDFALEVNPTTMSAQSTKQELSVNAITGARGVKIWGEGTSGGSETEKVARIPIAAKSNFELNFKYFGSELKNGVYVKENGKVYLDSEETAVPPDFVFTRVQKPTNLAYYKGNLRFDHTATTTTDYYVLTIVCVGLNGRAENIVVKLGKTATAQYADVLETIESEEGNFVDTVGNVVTIDFEKIITELQKIPAFANVYNQSAKVGFAVYAHQNRVDGKNVTICSDFATTNLDNSEIVCVVEKMPETALELDLDVSATDFVLNWSPVLANASYESETKYQVLINGEAIGESISALSKSFARSDFDDATYYEFSVVVENPYYVQSSTSNIVRIFKLDSVSSLKLFQDGSLGYDISSVQKDFVEYVKVTSASSIENNKTGKIDITEDGNLSLKVVGKKAIESDGKKTYYIDSQETTWTLAKMSTLKPVDESVSYENNTISWNAFGATENLNNLRYVLMFVDENGNIATYKTSATSENLTTNKELFGTLESLSGEVEISVSAYLETFPISGEASSDATYTVAAGKTIYYAKDVALPTGKTECNYYVYAGKASVNKFATPNITNAEFDSTGLSDSDLPTITVEFVGNYGQSRKFDIYLNGQFYKTETIARSDDKYKFELAPEDYNSKVADGGTLTIGVCALSDTDILSSIGTVNVVRAEAVGGIEFVTNEQNELTHKIRIALPQTGTDGGVVVKIVYQETGGEEKEDYVLVPVNEVLSEVEYDLGDILNKTEGGKKILAKGGMVNLYAHIASFSGSGKYYLACPTWIRSETYQILAGVDEVQKTSGGFVIDKDANSTSTTYIVECNNTTFEVRYENEQFYFEFPHGGQWTNGTYNISVYAKQEGFLPSVVGEIEFVLNKLSAISDIKILRDQDDLSRVALSWDAVAGATGYVFRMYEAGDTTRANLLYEYVEDRKNESVVVNTSSLIDIFGEGYQKLLDYGNLDIFALMMDKDVVFDVFVRGQDDVNDSDTYSFDATIKGNALEITNFEVNQYGVIVLNCIPEETYLYRFVTSDGTVLQEWTRLYAKNDYEKIDTKAITAAGGTYFNMEVVVVGNNLSEEISTKLDGLVVDSIAFTTKGSGTTYVVGTDIVRVGYIESEGSTDLSFELVTGSYTKLYVGLTEDAILSGQVAEFSPNFSAVGSNNAQEICTFSLSTIVDRLKAQGLNVPANNSDVDLFFWAFKMIDIEDKENSYCISHASASKFTYTNEIDFVEITKLGKDLVDTSKYLEDYANSFALFKNNDTAENKTTFGIYVKITQIIENNESDGEEGEIFEKDLSTTLFVDNKTLTSGDYFHDESLFVLNLTEVFEKSEFASLSGKFKFEFATLSVKDVDGSKQFVLSDWIGEANGKEFVFDKLKSIDRLELMSGSLTWLNTEEGSQKYYVYFIESLDENGGMGDNFAYTTVTTNKYVASYNASEFVGLGQGYYLAVRSVNEDPFVLPSQVRFVEASAGMPVKVEKNEIKSSLKIKDGKIFIPFVEGDDESLKSDGAGTDFVDYIKTCSESTDAVDKLVSTTFKAPFTFRLDDLVSGRIFVRFRFTSLSSGVQGKTQTFDVDARSLITSIFDIDDGYDYLDKLTRLESHAITGGSTLSSFISLMKDGSFGIGNYKMLFDDRFESLQSGEYKLEYCLLGNSSSLTSGWYSYSNNGQNSLYVNNQPQVQAIKTEAVGGYSSANSYKLMMRKSEVFSKESGTLSGEIAENYVMKIYNDAGKYYAFSIAKASDKYSLTLLGAESGTAVTVYETDEYGNETESGDFLMFYINMNGGNSILGRYGAEIEKGNFKMQIFAVGNDYSLSSKSNLFNLTLYGFGSDFTLNNGEFSWTPQSNAKATVVYKKNSSVGETVPEDDVIEMTATSARYSLDETGYGLYDYVDFVVIGDVYGNNILVDSEVYRVENVYKLEVPTLSNENGLIKIDDQINATLEGLDVCYSDLDLYNYKIYNDVSTSTEFIRITDQANAEKPIFYEVGTTGVSQTSADYSYKSTENSASTFYVASIGTTATFDIGDGEDAETYYMKRITFVNKSGVEFGSEDVVGIAVRSNYAPFEAKMLDRTSGLSIRNGVLTWNAVSGRSDQDLTISANEKIVYKVAVVQYDMSYSDDGEVENSYPNLLEFYTLENEFDFARIDEDRLNKSARYMRATVQAFAMNVSQSVPAVPSYLQLVEGGYAYGNVKYVGSDIAVLMGDGDTIRAIERSQSIDEGSLQVVDGKLVWTVTFDSPVEASADFADRYQFSVLDEDFNEIEGNFSYEQGLSDRQVVVTFAEYKGELAEKTQILTVYMTKLDSANSTIKSFGREVEITKLKTIYTSDYTITSDERDSNVEVVDFTNYFADNQANEVELLIYQNPDKSDTPISITFTSRRSKFYILGQEDNSITGNEAGFAGKFVVGQNSRLIWNFSVRNTTLANCLYSDVSDDIIIQRSAWGDGVISWNQASQRFEWTYGGYNALGESVEVNQVEKIIETNTDAGLFSDEEMQIPALSGEDQVVIPQGTEISVERVFENSSRITYLGEAYYISNDDYHDAVKIVAQTNLTAGTLFRPVEKYSDNETIIQTEDGRLCILDSSLVVEPNYIVEAIYGEGAAAITRTYNTTNSYFVPTIVGKVTIKVKIKLGESNIQSQALEYQGGRMVDFNLFAGGQGTSQNPYLIANETQFKNIACRLSKDKTLAVYTENGNIKTEEEKYYFSIQDDITFSSALTGILFEGKFTGEIRGNGHVLEYENSTTSKLTDGDITISEGNVKSSTDEDSTTISYGAALFETLTSTAVVKDLNLKVSLKVTSASPYITRNSLVSGLAITNSGKIDNVNVVDFSSNFVGVAGRTTRLMMIYSGIASINTGSEALITGCNIDTNMEFMDYDHAQLIFIGGVAFTNYATIDSCVSGDAMSTKTISVIGLDESDIVQAAGIVVTNASYSTLTNCHNYANITVAAQYNNDNFVVYMAGIASLANGTVDGNQNHGTITATNILEKNLHKGDISANEA